MQDLTNTREFSLFDEDNLPTAEYIRTLADAKQYAKLRELSESIPPQDIAELFDEVPKEYYILLFRLLGKELAAETFVEMDSDIQRALIDSFTDRELAEILDELYMDDTVDLIEEMPANVVKRIIKASRKEDREVISNLLRYPKDSAGNVMTTEYVRFVGDMTVGDALEHIREVAIDKETIYNCYITDKNLHLLGVITAKQLLISSLDTVISDIMEDNVISVNTHDDKEEVARLFDKYRLIALPVVDNESRLVGIVTVDDAIEVIQEETEDDISKMAAITPLEDTYLKTSVAELWKSRILWLFILLVTSTFSSAILNVFEGALPAVLILFVPMLMGTGGNSAGQSSVTLIRALSLGEVEYKDTLRVLVKETLTGILCGITLGVAAFGKVYLIDRLLMQNPEITVAVAFAVGAALAITVLMAKIIGAILPILAKRMGFDPAVMASPFITTIVDVIALVLYFLISRSMLSML